MNLYQIESKYYEIMNNIDYTTGELTDEQIQSLNALDGERENVFIAHATHIKNLEAYLDSMETAMNTMKDKKKRLQDNIDKLRHSLKSNLIINDMRSIEKCPYFKIRVLGSNIGTDIFDQSLIPKKYFVEKVKTTVDINKGQILDDMKNGISVPGVRFSDGLRLEIK